MLPVLVIVQQVYKKIISREEGCLRLMSIGVDSEDTNKTMIKFICKMLESFPVDSLGEIIQEDDLKSRYILPILQSLFDDLDSSNSLRFSKITNEDNAECKKMFDISRRRPDGQFRQKTNNGDLIPIGYMEAKSEQQSKNDEACMRDLVRLGVFGKNAIDINHSKSTLLIQAIGSNLIFYLLQKKATDVYTMVQLD